MDVTGADREVGTLIIGAGVTGLAFADWLGDDDYLIAEATDAIGGYCKTVLQDGFVWDYSGHFFHFRHREVERYLVARMGPAAVRTVTRDSRIWYRERFVDFPFQKNIHQLSKREFIECLVDLYFREDRPASSFRDMLYAKFGRAIADKFLVPYNEKLYATDLDTLDPDAMGRFFPYADFAEVLANFRAADNRGYNATFTYPVAGAIEYVRALAQGVDAGRVQLDTPVLEVDLGAHVARTSRGRVRYERLVSTAPLPRLLQMCGLPHDPAVYSANTVEVFNLGFDRKGPDGVHWIYYPQRELCFYRVGFYDNILGADRMSLYVEIGRPGPAAVPHDASATLGEVLEGLRRAGVVEDHRLVSHHRVVLDPAYVHITTASNADVRTQRARLGAQDVYSIGRYGGWTYCSIEDGIVEARALVEQLGLR